MNEKKLRCGQIEIGGTFLWPFDFLQSVTFQNCRTIGSLSFGNNRSGRISGILPVYVYYAEYILYRGNL